MRGGGGHGLRVLRLLSSAGRVVGTGFVSIATADSHGRVYFLYTSTPAQAAAVVGGGDVDVALVELAIDHVLHYTGGGLVVLISALEVVAKARPR